MKKVVLSIITICYNEKNIERTCFSIVNQKFQDFEWIVVDGGSTDGSTIKTLNKYKDRINVFISEKDKGRYDAMNKGIQRSTGEWIIFMNGGDCFYNNHVLKNVFENRIYKKIDILYGVPFSFLNNYNIIRNYPAALSFDFFKKDCINHQSCFIKKQVFEKFKLYDDSFQILGDLETWHRFLDRKCVFYYLGMLIARYDYSGISRLAEGSKLHEEERKRIYEVYGNKKDTYYLNDVVYTITSHVSITSKIKNFIHHVLGRKSG